MQRVAYENIDIRGQWGGNDATLVPAVEAMIDGELHVSEIISDTFPLSEWETAFEKARS